MGGSCFSEYITRQFEMIDLSDDFGLLDFDIKNGLLELHSKQDLWELRPMYYSNFPLKELRDKINQTLRTDKYMYTLKVKGKQHKSS
jgi:hypothetical protein